MKTLSVALATLFLANFSARAATMSASLNAPVVDGEDLANLGEAGGTDKWWLGSVSKGQTITTGGAAVRLKSISYQISDSQQATPSKTYLIRVGKAEGTAFTLVHSENATQDFTWNAAEFMTWTLDTPVLLEPYTTYGIDVGMLTSTSGWSSGIPYINQTGDDFPGGSAYSSGMTSSTLSDSIGSDRIFHLDIERPLDATFALAAVSPVDNATDVLANRNIVLTFSQNVTPGTGNLTIRDLTNSTDVQLAANDLRLTYDRNVVRIDPGGLFTWSNNYAIRIEAGMFLGDGGAPIGAINDDTTWNFTTLPGDPLLDALASLKNHITGAAPLTGTQIAALKTTIDNHRQRFAENATIISAVFDLISTYDTKKGPLFVSGSTVTDFNRSNTTLTSVRAVIAENYHWVVYTVMQHAMNVIYTAEALAAHKSLLQGFKFGSHTDFPGPCTPPADPLNTHTVAINGSFPITFGRNTQGWTQSARKPTGTYLAPGTIATVTVPPALVNAGYKVRVGAHSWDLSGRDPVERLERATRLYPLDAETIEVASPYGGGIYVEVPIGSSAGVVNVTVTGAVRAPYFSAKSFHQTTPSEWAVEKTHSAPWADFQSDKFMMQVPRTWIYNHPDPAQTMADWDAAMDAINSLMGFPLDRGKETMYCQVDVIMRSSVHAPGYPAVNATGNPNTNTYSGYRNIYLVRGPNVSLTSANIEFHEQGHAYAFPKFGGESESNVNLLQPAMLNRKFGRTFDEAQNGSFGSGRTFITVDNTAVAWMTVFNFSPREVPMANAEKAYQHKGHAKFMDIARLFGWEGLDAFWRSFLEDDANHISYPTDDDALLLRLSRHVGKDIRPLFHFWGIHPKNPSALAAAIAAENIPASIGIRDLLLHYKTLVPADNTAFRTFAQAWRGKKPSITGNWEEREHARQWDTIALYGTGDQQRTDATNPGEIYNEYSANDISNRVQELVDLYYPSSITPSPMSFAVAPSAVNATTIGMSATSATAAIGPIEYWFENTTNNSNSGWITSTTWQQTGLTTDQSYSFHVKARDGLLNETAWSQAVVVPLTSSGDVTPPAPSTMVFATPPYAMDENTITMTATTASDVNGVEYYFENTSGGGGSSGWQTSPVFTDGELSPSTEYGYRVKARDGQGNETAWSAPAITNTADIPDLTPPQIVSLSPGGPITDVAADLVATFDEPVIIGSGFVTLKNLTDGTQSQIAISDPAIAISGNILTIDLPSDLIAGKTYAVGIDANSVADASNNPFIGIDDDTTWSFEVILANPVADAGGPYGVPLGQSLSLDASGSQPSYGETIVSYEWDLNHDNTFGDVIGETPAAISDMDLTVNWGMISGPNSIQLKVTDSAGKTSTVSALVKLGLTFIWDANGATAGQTDGGGGWFDDNKWWDEIENTNWISGASAIFGNGGTGGTVTLASPVTVGSLAFDAFGGTYTLSGSSLAQGGITIGTDAGNVTFKSTTISGAGSITMNGSGILNLRESVVMTYTGPTVINRGVVLLGNSSNRSSANFTLNGGILTDYYHQTHTFTGGLGAGNNQIRIYGESGFGGGNGTSNWRIGTQNSILQWGSTYFNPTQLKFFAPLGDNMGPSTYGLVSFQNGLDLNNGPRTIDVLAATGPNAISKSYATITGAIVDNSLGKGGSLIKTGGGRLDLNTANTYGGGTTIQDGTLKLGNVAALGATSSPLTVNAGLLNINNQTVSIGNLTGSGGTIANDGNAARTLTIGTGNGTGGIYQGIIANNTNAGTGSLALTKTGTGTITLAGSNSYTGATSINGGTLVLTGATQATTSIATGANGSLGLVIGTPVTAASAAVDLTNGTVTVTGTPSGPSHTLLTAASITGAAVLSPALAGYDLQVVGGTELRLVQTTAPSAYGQWAAGNAPAGTPDDDYDGDGVNNAMEFVLGGLATTKDPGKLPLAATANGNMTFSFVRDHQSVVPSVNLTIELSNDLNDWSESHTVPDAATLIPPVTVVSGATTDTVTLTLPASGAKKFARLKVLLE